MDKIPLGHWLDKFQAGGVTKMGYKRNSPYKNQPFLDIDSNVITMNGVDIPLMLVPDNDPPVQVQPNSGEYHFPNSTKVREFKMRNGGVNNFISKWL